MNGLGQVSEQEERRTGQVARRVVFVSMAVPFVADQRADSLPEGVLAAASQPPDNTSDWTSVLLEPLRELSALATGTPSSTHYALAKAAIEAAKGEPPEIGEVNVLATLLAERLWKLCEYLRTQGVAVCRANLSDCSGTILQEEDGVVRLDALGATYLEIDFGQYGQRLAKRIREKSRERWNEYLAERAAIAGSEGSPRVLELWYDAAHGPTPVRFASVLASVIWHDLVQPLLQKVKQPALSLVVVERIQEAFWAPDRHVEHVGDEVVVVNASGTVVARLCETETAPALPEDVVAGLVATRSVTGHRLIRLLLQIGYCQHQIPGIREPSLIVIHGGFSALAQLLRLEGRRSSQELHEILQALQHTHIVHPHGEIGGLLTYVYFPEAPGRSAELRIRVADPLLPDYVVRLPKLTQSRRRARALVPVPRLLPPFVGRRNEWGAQAALQIQVMIELRRNACELVRNRPVEISRNRWLSMARRTGLPDRMVSATIERWTNDGDDGPAFLVRPEPDHFTLSRHYRRELNMLIEAGKMEADGQRRAKRRASRLQR